MNAVTFNVLNQTKILWSAFACFIFLGEKQSSIQILALVLLVISAVMMTLSSSSPSQEERPAEDENKKLWYDYDQENKNNHDQIFGSPATCYGLFAVLFASLISGFSGTIIQKTLQRKNKKKTNTKDGKKNPWIYTMELCTATWILMDRI